MKTAIGFILAESLIHGSTPAVAAQRAVGFDEAGALTTRSSRSDTESKLQRPRPVTDKGIKQFVLFLLRALRGRKKTAIF